MSKKIYLANQYFFSELERKVVLPPIIEKLEELGLEVLEPGARNNKGIDLSCPGWELKVGPADVSDMQASDAIFAIVNGCPPDEGVAVEIGMFAAWNKPTFLFRDDYRVTTPSGWYPLNLMLFQGIPQDNWRDYYYSSIDEITKAEKALYKWAKGENK